MSGKRLNSNEPSPRKAPPPNGRQGASAGKSPRSPKKDKKDRALRIAIITVAVLLALALGVLAWWRSFAKPPEMIEPDGSKEEIGSVSDIGAPVRVGGDRKQDFYTFLVIGRDTGGGGNTDTILLASYDLANQKMNVLSIPRDTMVNVSWDVKKINSVYNVYGGGDKGIEALGKEMAQLVGFTPDFQVVLEWKAVGELVDALGGVYFDVPRNMYYNDPSQNLSINIKKGYQKLSGAQAMQVVRFRDGPNGYSNGDLGRIETQQNFLKAVISQCLQISNVSRINELTKVFKDNVTTNLTIGNIAWFGEKAVFGGLKMENVNCFTMPCTSGGVWSRSYGQKLSYVLPKTDELVSLVNEHFNPYKDDLQKYELDIMYVNSDGTIASSTGKLEDTKANASLKSPKPTTPKPDTNTGKEPSSGTGSGTKPKPETPTTKPDVPTTPETPPTEPNPPSEPTVPPTNPEEGGGTTEPTPPPTEPTMPPSETGDKTGTQGAA